MKNYLVSRFSHNFAPCVNQKTYLDFFASVSSLVNGISAMFFDFIAPGHDDVREVDISIILYITSIKGNNQNLKTVWYEMNDLSILS